MSLDNPKNYDGTVLCSQPVQSYEIRQDNP